MSSQNAAEVRATELASIGIQFQADGDDQAARIAWQDALAYAEQHLPGTTIVSWIRSGFGDTLLRCGDYQGALEMAGSALEYCASVKAPLAALTMAKSHLRLGDIPRARDYARQACDLRGEQVYRVFSPADREALGVATPA